MIRTVLKKAIAILLALWFSGQLALLATEISAATRLKTQLRQQIEAVQQQLDKLEDTQPIEEKLWAMGYVYQGDVVFFDGG